jgi:hypothetical protein
VIDSGQPWPGKLGDRDRHTADTTSGLIVLESISIACRFLEPGDTFLFKQ